MGSRQLLKAIMPPVLASALKRVGRAVGASEEGLTYAPEGWQTELPEGTSPTARDGRDYRTHWAPFIERLAAGEAPSESLDGAVGQRIEEHNTWVTFAYVVALAAHGKDALKVLDYGGNLGYSYGVAKSFLPAIPLEYHCKDLPGIVEEGRKLNPSIIWHADDSCLDSRYDLVVMNSVLQYISDWRGVLKRVANAVGSHLFLTLPTVTSGRGYVAVERFQGAAALYQQINKTELIDTLKAAEFRLTREFLDTPHPRVAAAPEQPSFSVLLFQRR